MSSTLAEINNSAFDNLFDKNGEPKYKQEIKYKLITKPRDVYEEYYIPEDFDEWFRDMGGLEHPSKTDEDKTPSW